MLKYCFAFSVLLLSSCGGDEYPFEYNFTDVKLGVYGFYAIEPNGTLTEVDIIPKGENDIYEEVIMSFIFDNKPLDIIKLESESIATFTSNQQSGEVSYENINDILVFADGQATMRLNGNTLEMCTQLFLATDGPFTTMADAEYDVTLFDTCEMFEPYNEALQSRVKDYFIGDTLFFAQPLLLFE